MARPRQFDETQAVDAAMRAFWSAGYEGTSTQDLCAATGLGRSSIYNTFTGKRDLFERALRRYMAEKAATFEVLDAPGSAVDKVRALLWQIVDSPEDDPLGCLVVNTIVEFGPRDAEMAALLTADRDRRMAALITTLAAGQHAGEIEKSRAPEDLAEFIVATISGMRVAARGGATRKTLAGIATVALGCL